VLHLIERRPELLRTELVPAHGHQTVVPVRREHADPDDALAPRGFGEPELVPDADAERFRDLR
jgi:hypothetical protein